MAIYHLSMKNIGRRDGRSAVACAAYRSGEKLHCSTYGIEHDYTKKSGVIYKQIYAPEYTNKDLLNREKLWNAVEQAELKKDGSLKETARLAKEFEVALPCELTKKQHQKIVDDFCKSIVKKHNVIVDAAIHAPHTEGGSDERNYHAHIMITTRAIGYDGYLDKKAREFNDNGRELLVDYRKQWADLCNHELEMAGEKERISHLSNKARELETLPTVHEGVKITLLRRRGIQTDISKLNDDIKAYNSEIIISRQLEQTNTHEDILNASRNRLQARLDERTARKVSEQVKQAEIANQTQTELSIEQQKRSKDYGWER